ncbi:MAG TPA: flagellar hook-associated protein FlgK [Bryobacteraceae bacterium]|nr:flagellar hook-associated protein FlgK [Bryobacteraceae bacterium]
MANLFSSLGVTANAMRVFEQAIDVTGNNVTNASTPGYARQRTTLQAMAFDPLNGTIGGVSTGEVQNARDEYAEAQVRRQVQAWGENDQKATSLAALENIFPVAEGTGLADALNDLSSSFSAWSANPSSQTLREDVLAQADTVARAFQQAGNSLTQMASDTDEQIRQAVDQVNSLGSQLQALNQQRRNNGTADAGLDANLHATLESLAEWVDFTVAQQPDGTVTVLLGGQTPLVMGDRLYPIQAGTGDTTSSAVLPNTTIVSSDGREVTSQISSGRLGGLLDVRNRILPSFLGDSSQPGDLNRLAQGVADQINQILTSGLVTDGPPPVAGIPLFQYDAANPARTLSVNSDITADQLAAIDAGPPYSSNGTARKLANAVTETGQIDGTSLAGFYGNLSARAGREVNSAQQGRDDGQQMVAQARSQRDQLSGVSLDEEAMYLMEFQRAYQATAKMVTVLDDMLETTINLVR